MKNLLPYVLSIGAIIGTPQIAQATHGGKIVYHESRIESVLYCSGQVDAIKTIRPIQNAIENGMNVGQYRESLKDKPKNKLKCKGKTIFYTPVEFLCQGKMYSFNPDRTPAGKTLINIVKSNVLTSVEQTQQSFSVSGESIYVFTVQDVPEKNTISCLDKKFDSQN